MGKGGNPYHDERGRFTTDIGANVAGISKSLRSVGKQSGRLRPDSISFVSLNDGASRMIVQGTKKDIRETVKAICPYTKIDSSKRLTNVSDVPKDYSGMLKTKVNAAKACINRQNEQPAVGVFRLNRLRG